MTVQRQDVQLPAAPKTLRDRCDDPTKVPVRDLSPAEIQYYWSLDRASLVECRDRHGAVVTYYVTRDERISGSRR